MARVARRQSDDVARVLLRLPADLHRAATRAAAAEGVSFNEFCIRRLRAAPATEEVSGTAAEVQSRATTMVGGHLVGLVALGSWVRGEAAASSDVDVLIVLSAHTPVTRDLYRQWDAFVPLSMDGRPIDAHFVAGTTTSALWYEAAVDGMVWLDRTGEISRHLAGLRRNIAEGRVTRGYAHGQPYWKERAS